MTTLTASDARKRLYNLVDEVKDTHVPVQIVGKRNSAVLISEEDWRCNRRNFVSHVNSRHAGINKKGFEDTC